MPSTCCLDQQASQTEEANIIKYLSRARTYGICITLYIYFFVQDKPITLHMCFSGIYSSFSQAEINAPLECGPFINEMH